MIQHMQVMREQVDGIASIAASSDGDVSPTPRVSTICSRAGSASAACTAALLATSFISSYFIDSIFTELTRSVKMGAVTEEALAANSGHRHAEIAERIDIAATAICHHMTVDGLKRPGPVLHPTGQSLGRSPDGRPGLGPSRWAPRSGSATPSANLARSSHRGTRCQGTAEHPARGALARCRPPSGQVRRDHHPRRRRVRLDRRHHDGQLRAEPG